MSSRRTRLNGFQNAGTNFCWALTQRGTPCTRKCYNAVHQLPFCPQHYQTGDSAFSVKSHPVAGKILVANFDLPKGYKSVYFGTRKAYNKCSKTSVDYALSFVENGGVIDPTSHHVASKLQYMSNPGPSERSNVNCTDVTFGMTRDKNAVGREYKLTEDVKKNGQLLQFYGNSWFASRDLERVNVGTAKFPAPQRKRKKRKAKASTGSASSSTSSLLHKRRKKMPLP